MHRMACVDLPGLPLQLVLRRHPEWKRHPAAIVDRDKPHGRILWVNERARRARILPGMRYAAALSLSGGLRAAEVSSVEIDRAVESILARLRDFAPEVEPAREEPGVFWLNASGLAPRPVNEGPVNEPSHPPAAPATRVAPGSSSELANSETGSLDLLYESLSEWACLIRSGLERRERLKSTVVVGFSKFATWALAKAGHGVTVSGERADETAAVRRVALECLALEPKVRDTLYMLGVRTVGDFADLPPEGIEKRFGEGAWRLYRQSRGEFKMSLVPRPPEPPVQQRIHLDYAETDVPRLMVVIERAIQPLLKVLVDRGQAVAEIRVDLRFDDTRPRTERIRPAAPTIDGAQLSKLIELRLESTCGHSEERGRPEELRRPEATLGRPEEMDHLHGVTDMTLTVEGTRVTGTQLELFQRRPPRDLSAANRALAFIRAKFGEHVVLRARLRQAHLPEALFSWEALKEIKIAAPRDVDSGTLVRRMYGHPLELPARPRHEPDGWMLRGLAQGPVVRVLGPYIVSGGWWRKSVHREYHFAETQEGELLWVYYDRCRRRWFIQGRVE